jgi:hypothetical protein
MTNSRRAGLWTLLTMLAAPGMASAQVNVKDVRLGVGAARHLTFEGLDGCTCSSDSATPSGPAFEVDLTLGEGRRARLGFVATAVIHPSGLKDADLSLGVRWTFLDRARVSPFFHATADVLNIWRTGVGGGVHVRLSDRFGLKYQLDVSLLIAEEYEEMLGHMVAFVWKVPIPKR